MHSYHRKGAEKLSHYAARQAILADRHEGAAPHGYAADQALPADGDSGTENSYVAHQAAYRGVKPIPAVDSKHQRSPKSKRTSKADQE
jgi:hypothetical protein